MNKNNIFFILIFFILLFFNSCSVLNNPAKIKTYIMVTTTKGDFVIGLYEGTPQHKSNFLSNINTEFYDSTLVYSVIQNGLVKFGLPVDQLKEEDFLEENLSNSNLKPEINSKLINKKGAVAMIRMPDESNPDKISDKYLFYVVEGVKTDEKLLKTLEANRNAPIIAEYISAFLNEPGNSVYKDSLDFYRAGKKNDEWNRLYVDLTGRILPRIENDGIKLFKMSKFQLETYSSTGGSPIYDGQFTVFGEIIYGFDVVTNLSKLKTNARNKPKENIYILSTKILTKKELIELNN